MTDYVVIYERGKNGTWHARAADLPVYAIGDSREEAESEVRSAISFYLECLRAQNEPVPVFASEPGVVTVS